MKPYEPGQEIQLDCQASSRKFFSKALGVREQLAWTKRAEQEEKELSKVEQIESALSMLAEHITRIEPPIEVSKLADILDERQLWQLWVSVRINDISPDEKKS